jgi:hypothetical protein
MSKLALPAIIRSQTLTAMFFLLERPRYPIGRGGQLKHLRRRFLLYQHFVQGRRRGKRKYYGVKREACR